MGIGGICSKVVVPISMCDLKGHLYLNNVLLVVNPRIDTKRDWTMCSNIVYHSKCNSQHHFFIFFKFVFFGGGSSNKYEEINYMHGLELSIISLLYFVSYGPLIWSCMSKDHNHGAPIFFR